MAKDVAAPIILEDEQRSCEYPIHCGSAKHSGFRLNTR